MNDSGIPSHMADSSAVICGLAHQCARHLPRTLAFVDKLRACFRESDVVVFENGSRDDTLQILKAWGESVGRTQVLSEPFPEELLAPPTPGIDPAFSMARIRRMAWARNQYFDFVKAHYNPDFLVILDFDLFLIPLEGVMTSFSGLHDQWDGVFSNSRGFRGHHMTRGRVYWDTYAYKPTGDTAPLTTEQIFQSQHDLKPLKSGDEWLRVASAFGGLGIYRWESIKPHRYECRRNDDPEIEAVCEHVSLHRDMATQGHDRFYINPDQLVYYDSVFLKAERFLLRLQREYLGGDGGAKN